MNLALGEPMPTDRGVLPDPVDVARLMGSCAVAPDFEGKEAEAELEATQPNSGDFEV